MTFFENQKGSAARSEHKTVRVATHIPVLQRCFDTSPVPLTCVIEHGTGLASTEYFRKCHSVNTILSLEDDPYWLASAQQTIAQHPGMQKHSIFPFESEEQFKARLKSHTCVMFEPEEVIALVDGPHKQRITVIETMLSLGTAWVVEHDAESLPLSELSDRLTLCKKYGYRTYQYVALNPETLLYCKSSVDVPDFVSITA